MNYNQLWLVQMMAACPLRCFPALVFLSAQRKLKQTTKAMKFRTIYDGDE